MFDHNLGMENHFFLNILQRVISSEKKLIILMSLLCVFGDYKGCYSLDSSIILLL